MKVNLRLPSGWSAQIALNRCGYATFRDPNTGQTSYVRRLGAYFYPRFHCYVQQETPTDAMLSIHLDMKQPTYLPGRAHSGEYESDGVKEEIRRIVQICASAPHA